MTDPLRPEAEPARKLAPAEQLVPAEPAEPAFDGGEPGPVPPEPPTGPASPVVAPPVRATRAGRAWVGIAVGLVVLGLLLVFVFQNLHDTTIQFFTAKGSLPVALALIFSAIAGAAVVLLVGSVRIIQLRRHVRASYRAGADDARGAVAPLPPGRRGRGKRGRPKGRPARA